MVLFLFEKVCYNESSLKMWKKDCAYESLSENEVEDFINDLYLMRKESLAKDGEWGTGNLVFKEFRNQGIL